MKIRMRRRRKVYAALRKALNPSLRLYPEPQSDTLRLAAAKVYGVKPANILAGNGSDEILSILLRCFVGPRDRVAYPFPTYSLYDTLIAIQDGVAAPVAYPADFSLPASLAEQKAALTFLCNPNAPSGTLVTLPEIEKLARSLSGHLWWWTRPMSTSLLARAHPRFRFSPAFLIWSCCGPFPSHFPWPVCASGSRLPRRKLSPA